MTDDGSRLVFGSCEFDPGTFQLRRNGVLVEVEPKALDLLRLLLDRAPRVVEKSEIFSIVWKDVAVTDNVLTRLVAQLRRALDDDAKAPRYIETVTTRGYRFIADVRPERSQPRPLPPAATAVRRSGRVWAAGLLVVAAGALLVLILGTRGSDRQTATAATSAPDVAAFASAQAYQMIGDRGFSGFPAYSTDGKNIAYSSDESGALEIYVKGLAPGSTPMKLTSNGRQNIQPAWSPDGQVIAYHEMASGGIWAVPSRGGVPRQIADFGSCPSWSPDGRYLAFQSLVAGDINGTGRPGVTSTIWIVQADGRTAPERLTTSGDPAGPHLAPQWWHDSKRIVFTVPVVPQGQALWSVDVDDRATRLVSAHERLSPLFSLSSRVKGVYFKQGGGNALWWLPLSDQLEPVGEPQPTGLSLNGSSIQSFSLSSDGRHLSWTAAESSGNVWAVEGDGDKGAPDQARPLTTASGVRYGLPAPSSTGRLVVVGLRPGSHTGLYLLLPDGGVRQLTTDPPNHGGPVWMPGEKEIAFVTNHGDGVGFWALDPETARERKLFLLSSLPRPPGQSHPSTAAPSTGISFSRDFRRLAMAIVQDGTSNVWIAGLREFAPDGTLVQRTFEKEGGSYPILSPDGRAVAYQCSDGDDTHLCVTGTEQGERIRLTRERGQSWTGGWLRDGTRILIAARRDAVWNVASVSSSTPGDIRVLTHFTEPRMYVRYPRWDDAKGRVVFERYETTGKIWSVDLP